MDNKPLSFSNSQSREGEGNEVMEAFGLSNVYYVLSPSGAGKVEVDAQSHHPQRHPSEGSLLGGQT